MKRMNQLSIQLCLGLTLLAAISNDVAAQDGGWATQEIRIRPGVNLIWLDLDPVPDQSENIFGVAVLESVWAFAPGRELGDRGGWAVYRRTGPAFLNSLGRVQGKRGYVVYASSSTTLRVTGNPVNRSEKLSTQAPSLLGASVSGSDGSTFQAFFSRPELKEKLQAIYGIDGGAFIKQRPEARLQSGTSYWVAVSADAEHAGAIQVGVPPGGLHFGTDVYSRKVRISVPARDTEQRMMLRALPSVTPPPGQAFDAGGGDATWLEHKTAEGKWQPLGDGLALTVPAGAVKVEAEIRASRRDRAAATLAGTLPASYQSILEVTHDTGQRVLLAASMEVATIEGVWVGQVRLTHAMDTKGEMKKAPAFFVPLILAIDKDGRARILDQYQLEDATGGEPVVRRHYSTMFAQPVVLEGTVGDGATSGTLSGETAMESEHPLNPFRHRYNPQHRNGPAIRRLLRLEFSSDSQDEVDQILGVSKTFGQNEIGGFYHEQILGVMNGQVWVAGAFKLRRVSSGNTGSE